MVLSGIIAGGVGSAIGNPTDVVLVRLCLPCLFLEFWFVMVVEFLSAEPCRVGTAIQVRMQADQRRPPELRRNYRNIVDGLSRMVREEGPMSLTKVS